MKCHSEYLSLSAWEVRESIILTSAVCFLHDLVLHKGLPEDLGIDTAFRSYPF